LENDEIIKRLQKNVKIYQAIIKKLMTENKLLELKIINKGTSNKKYTEEEEAFSFSMEKEDESSRDILVQNADVFELSKKHSKKILKSQPMKRKIVHEEVDKEKIFSQESIETFSQKFEIIDQDLISSIDVKKLKRHPIILDKHEINFEGDCLEVFNISIKFFKAIKNLRLKDFFIEKSGNIKNIMVKLFLKRFFFIF
jgi:hypothetical protein